MEQLQHVAVSATMSVDKHPASSCVSKHPASTPNPLWASGASIAACSSHPPLAMALTCCHRAHSTHSGCCFMPPAHLDLVFVEAVVDGGVQLELLGALDSAHANHHVGHYLAVAATLEGVRRGKGGGCVQVHEGPPCISTVTAAGFTKQE